MQTPRHLLELQQVRWISFAYMYVVGLRWYEFLLTLPLCWFGLCALKEIEENGTVCY